jgi:hypothetical protein
MKVDVRACPCCGSTKLYVGVTSCMNFGVICQSCRLQISVELPWENKKKLSMNKLKQNALMDAVGRWNRRATSDVWLMGVAPEV